MQQGKFINVFLARHVSGTYAHHQEHTHCHYLIYHHTKHPQPRQRLDHKHTQPPTP